MRNINLNISPDILRSSIGTELKENLEEVVAIAADAIHATDIEIRVEFGAEYTIDETGVGGSTENPHLISVWLDSDKLGESMIVEVKSTIVHEMHHAMRNRIIPWPGTLLDDIIAEGLADHFDMEVNGCGPKPWSVSLTSDEIVSYEVKAKPLFNHQNTESDYYKWVLGTEDDDIPKWAGYALGFKMVKNYLELTGKKSYELVGVSSEEIIR